MQLELAAESIPHPQDVAREAEGPASQRSLVWTSNVKGLTEQSKQLEDQASLPIP